MKPGVYHNLPMSEYLADTAISKSGWSKFAQSPLDFQQYIKGISKADSWDYKKNGHFNIGQAWHTWNLEPELFWESYVIVPKLDMRKKDDKAQFAELREHSGHKTPVMQADFDTIKDMDRAIKSGLYRTAEGVLNAQGETELSLFWDDPDFGFPCKCRIDKTIPASRALCDLKSTKSAHPWGFGADAGKLKYHWQAVWNRDGYDICTDNFYPGFIILAQEKAPPFKAAVYSFTEDQMIAGKNALYDLKIKYARCLEKDVWPSYEDIVHRLDIPKYHL